MDELLTHFAAARAPRGREACGCCEGDGSHGRETCTRCTGTGFVRAGSDEPWCPSRSDDQPAPSRRHWREPKTAASPDDYGLSHRPMKSGAPLHDLTGEHATRDDVTSYLPKDYLTHPNYNSDTIPPSRDDYEALAQMRKAKGKPEARVHIYRATHKDAPHEINHGDWVTLSRGYAAGHAYAESGSDDPAAQYRVHHAVVAAKHVRDGGGGGYREQGYWGPSITCCGHQKTAAIRRVPPAEYGKYEYPDYPAKTLPALAKYFRKHEPDYYAAVHAHVGEHGVQEAMLVRSKDPRGTPLKRPRVMSGHHRAAAAFEHGQDIPVGDYDDGEDYDASNRNFGHQWWRDHHELKESYPDPRYKQGVLHGPDELPPDPGTHPIPEGHVRLWHYTRPTNIASIREHGLLRSRARGDSGTGDLSEPSAGVWASTKRPDDILDEHSEGRAAVVEFHAHPDEISGNAESPWHAQNKDRSYDPAKVQEWAKGYHHVIMRGDVHPRNILAVHEGWHGAARYMKHDDPTLKNYQWIKDEPDEPHNEALRPYRRGLEALEKQGAVVPAAERTESVRHMLDHYKPYDFDTWDEVRHNFNWDHPATKAFVADVARNGVKRPIPVDYDQDPPQVRNGHTRLLAAERAGVKSVPTRRHEGFMDPDDPDHLGRGPDDPEHWTNSWERDGSRKPYSHLKFRTHALHEASISPDGHQLTAARQREGDERAFGDYTMRYHTEDNGERKPRHVIETHHQDGSVVGRLNWYGTTGVVHHIETAGPEDTGEYGRLGNGQDHRRKGIATAMWNWGQEMSPKPKHSGDRTEQGKGWAKSVGGPGLQKHQGSAGWSYDHNIKGQVTVTRPGGQQETHHTDLVGYGLNPKSLRHPEDVPSPLYHGSRKEFEPGEHIESGHPGNFVSRMTHVYATEDPEGADPAGPKGARGYGQHVHEVKPTGWYGHRRDARGAEWASSDPWEVVAKVPRPGQHEGVMAMGMRNPHTGGSEWFHGTQARPEELGHGFDDPASMASGGFEMPDAEEGGHWNSLLGTHFTADHDVAKQFAKGEHASGANDRQDDEFEHEPRPVSRGVVHARLGLHNPKIYASEHDMDHEAYEYEHAAGNHPSNHVAGIGSHDEDDDDAYEAEETWPNAHRIAKDYGHDKISAGTYGHYGTQLAGHPMRTGWLNTHPDKFDIAERFKQRLQDQGHDGVIYGNEYEKSKHGANGNRSAIAFHPHQIEVTQHHHADNPCLDPEEAEHSRARMPGAGQQELAFERHGAAEYDGPDEDAAHPCSQCGSGPGHVRRNGEVLLHRGIGDSGAAARPDNWLPENKPGQPYHGAEEMMADEGPGGDLHKEIGQWWGTKSLARHYGDGGADSGLHVSAWFPEDKVGSGGVHHEGHVIPGGVSGRVHQVHVRSGGQWQRMPHSPGFRVTAAWTPSARIFGPTYGLDHRLFDGDHLKPAVRQVLMTRLAGVLAPVLGPDWHVLTTVWLAGSQASKWTGPDLEGNGDLDVLIGLSHTHARLASPSLSALNDQGIEKHLNTILQARFNESHWHPPFDPAGKEYDLTGYVNHVSNIRQIKPYAAYDMTNDDWTVKPPDLPDWSADQLPQGPAIFQEARALAAQVRAVLRLPEPFRSQEASRIWDSLHAARGQDFSETGLGWQGSANVLEKFLDQAHGGLIEKLKALKYAPGNTPMALAHGMTTADVGSVHA